MGPVRDHLRGPAEWYFESVSTLRSPPVAALSSVTELPPPFITQTCLPLDTIEPGPEIWKRESEIFLTKAPVELSTSVTE